MALKGLDLGPEPILRQLHKLDAAEGWAGGGSHEKAVEYQIEAPRRVFSAGSIARWKSANNLCATEPMCKSDWQPATPDAPPLEVSDVRCHVPDVVADVVVDVEFCGLHRPPSSGS
ncbi:MAG: hypothetical protein FJX64_11985 [Alphaproteobacteria bacterium]|nr:hypothetical protein [Alphaproteobacteria bacterium]